MTEMFRESRIEEHDNDLRLWEDMSAEELEAYIKFVENLASQPDALNE